MCHVQSYVSLQALVDFLLQLVHCLRVGGQRVQDERQRHTGGLVATEYKDYGLSEDLVLRQTCNDKRLKFSIITNFRLN